MNSFNLNKPQNASSQTPANPLLIETQPIPFKPDLLNSTEQQQLESYLNNPVPNIYWFTIDKTGPDHYHTFYRYRNRKYLGTTKFTFNNHLDDREEVELMTNFIKAFCEPIIYRFISLENRKIKQFPLYKNRSIYPDFHPENPTGYLLCTCKTSGTELIQEHVLRLGQLMFRHLDIDVLRFNRRTQKWEMLYDEIFDLMLGVFVGELSYLKHDNGVTTMKLKDDEEDEKITAHSGRVDMFTDEERLAPKPKKERTGKLKHGGNTLAEVDVATQLMISKRREKALASKVKTMAQLASGVLVNQEHTDKMNRNIGTKAIARREYQIRHAPELHLKDMAPILIYEGNEKLTALQRLESYNAKHYCPHKLKYNIIVPMYCKDNQICHFNVKCDHEREKITPIMPADFKCRHCGAKEGFEVLRSCDCKVIQCKRCTYRLYHYKQEGIDIYAYVCICKRTRSTFSEIAELQMYLWRHVKTQFTIKIDKPRTYAAASTGGQQRIQSRKDFLAELKSDADKKKATKIEAHAGKHKKYAEFLKDKALDEKTNPFQEPLEFHDWNEERQALFEMTQKRQAEEAYQRAMTEGHREIFEEVKEEQPPAKPTRNYIIQTVLDFVTNMRAKFTSVYKFFTDMITLKGAALVLANAFRGVCNFLSEIVYIFNELISYFKERPASFLLAINIAKMFGDDISPLTLLELTISFKDFWDYVYPPNGVRKGPAFFGIIGMIFSTVISAYTGITAHSGICDGFEQLFRAINVFEIPGFQYIIKSFLVSFNTVVSSAKNLGYLFRKFISLLPDFITSLIIPFDSKMYIHKCMQDAENPIHIAYAHALAFQTTLGREVGVNQLAEKRAVAKEKIRLAYVFIREEKITMDANWIGLMRYIGQMVNSDVPATGRTKEPFTIRLSGRSGCGKSTVWPILLSALYPDLKPIEIKSKFYVRNPRSDYWDGIQEGVEGILYDDFNQDREEKDLAEIIALVSQAEFLPPIATLDSNRANKGLTIDPKFVVLLSNAVDINARTLADNEAINRRRHIHLFMENTELNPEQMRFKILYSTGGRFAKLEDLTLKQAIAAIGLTYRSYTEKFTTINEDFLKVKYTVGKEDELELIKDVRLERNYYARFAQEIPRMQEEAVKEQIQKEKEILKKDIKLGVELQTKTQVANLAVFDVIQPHSGGVGHISSMILLAASGSLTDTALWTPLGQRIWNWNPCNSSLLKLLKNTALVAASFGLFYLAVKVLLQMMRKTAHSGETNTTKVKSVKVTPHAGEQVYEACIKNIVKMQLPDGMVNNGIFVKGNIVLTNLHFFYAQEGKEELIEDGTLINIYEPGREGVVETEIFRKENIIYLDYNGEDRDIILYRFSERCRRRKDITHMFSEGTDILNNRHIKLFLFDNQRNTQTIMTRVEKDFLTIEYDAHVGDEVKEIVQHNTFMYQFQSQRGFCGLPVFSNDNELEGKIIGIHSAGCRDKSYALIVTRQIIEAALANREVVTRVEKNSGIIQTIVTPEIIKEADINPYVYGTVTKPLFIPSKTTIIPSVIHDQVFKHITIPAILNQHDRRLEGVDIYRNGINKYVGSERFDPEDVKLALTSIAEEINSKKTTAGKKILTWDETINGIPGKDYFDGLNMSTSPGYPYVLLGKTKKQLFDFSEGKYQMKEELREMVENIEYHFKRGEIVDLPYLDYLKDERRPIKTVLEEKKTRLFSAAPLALVLIVRKYFLSFVAHWYSLHNECFSGVGINKGSREWHTMVNYLMETSEYGFDGDYSKFDGTVNPELVQGVADIVNDYYKDDHSLLRKAILVSDSQALHIFKRFIYCTRGGVQSGSPLTVVINTIVGECYLRIAFMKLMPEGMNSLYYYRRYIRTKIYGDDNVVSVPLDYIEFYNAKTVGDFLRPYKIYYGAAIKGTEQVAFKKITETSFLKNAIGKMHGFYVPLMEKSACLETINWIRQCNDELGACEDNINSVLRALYFYGRQEFDTWREKILKAEGRFNLLSFRELDAEFREYGVIASWGNDYGFTKQTAVKPEIQKLTQLRQQILAHSGKVSGSSTNMTDTATTTPQSTESTLDETTHVPLKGEGVTLVEQDKPAVVTKELAQDIYLGNKRATSHLAERPWTLESMLSRKTLVDTIKWSLTDAPTTVLKTYDVVTDLLTQDVTAINYTRFNYNRFKTCKAYFQLVASRFYQGRIIIVFVPTMRPKTKVIKPKLDIRNLYSYQHIVLDPAQGSNAELAIDFNYYKGYLDIQAGDALGQIYVIVENQLQAVAGSPNFVEMKFFVTFEESEFKVLRSGGTSYRQLRKILDQMQLDEEGIVAHSGVMDKFKEAFEPANLIGDLLSILDKPQSATQPDVITRKTRGYLSSTKGVEYVDKLVADPGAQQLCDEEHFNTKNVLKVSKFTQKVLSYVDTIQWKAADEPGKILYTMRVGPMAHITHEMAGNNVNLSPLEYMAHMFEHWRGSLNYVLDVVNSQFHEGRLDITFHPNVDTAPATIPSGMSQYAVSFVVRGAQNAISVSAPFLSDKPWRKVHQGYKLSATGGEDSFRFQDYFSGVIAIRVGASLRAPETVVPFVEINLFEHGGDDFEFCNPTISNSSFVFTNTPARINAHSGKGKGKETTKDTKTGGVKEKIKSKVFDVNMDPHKQESHPMAPDKEFTYDPAVPHFGEKYENLQELAKRYSRTIPDWKGYKVSNELYFTTTFDSFMTNNSVKLPFQAKLLSLYRLFRGPICLKIKPRFKKDTQYSERFHGYIYFTPIAFPVPDGTAIQTFMDSNISSQANPMAYFDQNHEAEIEIPFLTLSGTTLLDKYFDSMNIGDVTAFTNFRLFLALRTDTGAEPDNIEIDTLMAFGDETQVGCYVGIPPMRLIAHQYPDDWGSDNTKTKTKTTTQQAPPHKVSALQARKSDAYELIYKD